MKKFTIVLATVFLYTMPTICMNNGRPYSGATDAVNSSDARDYAGNYNTNANTPEAQVDSDGMTVQALSNRNDRDSKSKKSHDKAKMKSSSKKNSSKKSKKSSGKAKVRSMNDDSNKHHARHENKHHEDKQNRHARKHHDKNTVVTNGLRNDK